MPQPVRPFRSRWLLAAAAVVLATPAGAQQPTTHAITGEIRIRNEAFRPLPAAEWDNFTLLRTRVGLLATVNPRLGAFAQIQDARVFGDQPTTVTGIAQALDLHQGFLELRAGALEAPFVVRAGRQEMVIANERLVGAAGWSNTGRSFDALRVALGTPTAALRGSAHLATIHEGGNRFGHTNRQNLERDYWFMGVHVRTGGLDGYLLHDRNGHFGGFSDVDRFTLAGIGQSLRPGRLPVSLTLEGAYQFGSQRAELVTGPPREQDIRAWLASGRLAFLTGAAALPSIGAGIDVLSGGESPTADTYRAFRTLFGTSHRFHGYMDLFPEPATTTGGRGLIDGIASARLGIGDLGILEVDAHRFLLANATGIPHRDIGWELDLTFPFRVAEAARLAAGYSLFRNGPAAPALGFGLEGRVWHWGFVQATLAF